MRKLLVGIAAVAVISTAAFAQVRSNNVAPRQFNTQQTHYLRFTATYNACVLVSNTCSYKVGALPYNAFVVRAYQQVYTAFNSASTDTLAIGVSKGGAELVAAQSVHSTTAGLPLTVVAANLGTAATGNNATATGSNGGFEVYATYAQTGTAPTAGNAVVIVEYIAPNDGSCQTVPLGSTAAGC